MQKGWREGSHLGGVHAEVDLHQLEAGHLLLQLQLQARIEELCPGYGVAARVLLTRVRLTNLRSGIILSTLSAE